MAWKNIFLWFLILTALFKTPFALAEQSVPRVILFNEEDEFLRNAPIFYSYESGQWMTASAGSVITKGNQAPDFTLPFLKESPKPVPYPHWARERGWEGRLVTAIEIREDGTIGRWKIMQSTGYQLLDHVALRAIQKWRFEPAKQNGKPIASCIQIPVAFYLDPNNRKSKMEMP